MAIRETKRGQQRNGMLAKRAEKTLDADDEGLPLVTGGPPITSMADERFGSRTMGTIARRRKRQVRKLALIMLDIQAKICDNDHTGDRAYGYVLVEGDASSRPISFLG